MTRNVFGAVGIGLAMLLAIVALVAFTGREGTDNWWLPVAIGGIVVGAWWTIGGMFVKDDPPPAGDT